MLVGHFAIGLIGKRLAPTLSLGTLTVAAMLPDLLGFVFVIIGLEHWEITYGGRGIERIRLSHIGLSHSLAMDAIWAVLFAGLYWWRNANTTGSLILFGAVVSHWVLDFVSHQPDMPLLPGRSPVYGLGLWTSLPLTIVLEGGFWLASLILYVRLTSATSRAGGYMFWPVVALLTASWILSVSDPTPPIGHSLVSAAIAALVWFAMIVVWAYWMNRLRPVRGRLERRVK